MYTWGYIKDAVLAKLNLTEEEASALDIIRKFKIYANEAMTIICSTVKPKKTYYDVTVADLEQIVIMPNDFVSFGDDVNYIEEENRYGNIIKREAYDDDFIHYGYNKLKFYKTGKYSISYNARWLEFAYVENDMGQDDGTILDAPLDVLECLPSFIASNCCKIDNEYNSAVFKNEFEMMLARLDDTDYKSNKTFTIRGDW